MNHLRPKDLVRLKHTPGWTGLVIAVDDVDLDYAFVAHEARRVWIPLDLLELVPGQFEGMAA